MNGTSLDNAEAYRQIEELNVHLESKVRERTAALEQFLARVSHDLRTPLTSITGFADNLVAGLAGPLTDKQRQYLTRILANSGRLRRLVDDLLDMLVDPDQIKLSLDNVDLSAVASDVVEQLRPLALTKRQHLMLTAPDQPLIVWADGDKVTRVLTNLVDNAIKYTPTIRQLLVDRLAAIGYAVETASDGEEALSTLRSRRYDGLILDIGMPRLTGLEVLQHIREEQPGLPVIIITAAEARERALVAMQAGAQAYLLKPFEAGQLQSLIQQWVPLR